MIVNILNLDLSLFYYTKKICNLVGDVAKYLRVRFNQPQMITAVFASLKSHIWRIDVRRRIL